MRPPGSGVSAHPHSEEGLVQQEECMQQPLPRLEFLGWSPLKPQGWGCVEAGSPRWSVNPWLCPRGLEGLAAPRDFSKELLPRHTVPDWSCSSFPGAGPCICPGSTSSSLSTLLQVCLGPSRWQLFPRPCFLPFGGEVVRVELNWYKYNCELNLFQCASIFYFHKLLPQIHFCVLS